MQQLRQATLPARLRASLRAIRLETGPTYEDVLSRVETTETPAITTTGPLPAIRPNNDLLIQVGSINPAIIEYSPDCSTLLMAGYRTTCLGRRVRMPSGLYEIIDMFYHQTETWRIMARVRPVGIRS